jgi:hypothetical protein
VVSTVVGMAAEDLAVGTVAAGIDKPVGPE